MASGKPVMVKSVHRTRSRRMKFCVQRGLGALPATSRVEGKITAGFFPLRAECISTGIACQYCATKHKALLKLSMYMSNYVEVFFDW